MWWHVSLSDSSERCVLDHATPLCCKFNSKSPAHIFKHHLWNMLINKPILAFIPHYDWILCRSWRSKWVVSDCQQRWQHSAMLGEWRPQHNAQQGMALGDDSHSVRTERRSARTARRRSCEDGDRGRHGRRDTALGEGSNGTARMMRARLSAGMAMARSSALNWNFKRRQLRGDAGAVVRGLRLATGCASCLIRLPRTMIGSATCSSDGWLRSSVETGGIGRSDSSPSAFLCQYWAPVRQAAGSLSSPSCQKSNLHHQIIVKVQFSTFNYKIGHRPSNCRNRTNLAIEVVLKVVCIFLKYNRFQKSN